MLALTRPSADIGGLHRFDQRQLAGRDDVRQKLLPRRRPRPDRAATASASARGKADRARLIQPAARGVVLLRASGPGVPWPPSGRPDPASPRQPGLLGSRPAQRRQVVLGTVVRRLDQPVLLQALRRAFFSNWPQASVSACRRAAASDTSAASMLAGAAMPLAASQPGRCTGKITAVDGTMRLRQQTQARAPSRLPVRRRSGGSSSSACCT